MCLLPAGDTIGSKLATGEGKVDGPILPFGHVLKTPKEKENFRF
jgi:hypothetical protein